MVEKVVNFQKVEKKLHVEVENKYGITLRVFLEEINEDIDLIPIPQNLYFL